MTQTKTDWRRALLGVRRSLGESARRAASRAIVERIAALPALAEHEVILLYRPMGAEVDVGPLAAIASARGLGVVFPEEGPGGLPILDPATEASASRSDTLGTFAGRSIVAIVPGLGFDRNGTRLGRGRGYYDRAIARLRDDCPLLAVGVAFEVQLVFELPVDPWDQPVDLIVTETQLVAPGAQAAAPRVQRAAGEVPRP